MSVFCLKGISGTPLHGPLHNFGISVNPLTSCNFYERVVPLRIYCGTHFWLVSLPKCVKILNICFFIWILERGFFWLYPKVPLVYFVMKSWFFLVPWWHSLISLLSLVYCHLLSDVILCIASTFCAFVPVFLQFINSCVFHEMREQNSFQN